VAKVELLVLLRFSTKHLGTKLGALTSVEVQLLHVHSKANSSATCCALVNMLLRGVTLLFVLSRHGWVGELVSDTDLAEHAVDAGIGVNKRVWARGTPAYCETKPPGVLPYRICFSESELNVVLINEGMTRQSLGPADLRLVELRIEPIMAMPLLWVIM